MLSLIYAGFSRALDSESVFWDDECWRTGREKEKIILRLDLNFMDLQLNLEYMDFSIISEGF